MQFSRASHYRIAGWVDIRQVFLLIGGHVKAKIKLTDLEHKPVNFINDTAWPKGLKMAGVENLHVHDIRHTVGLRLRLTGVGQRTQGVIL